MKRAGAARLDSRLHIGSVPVFQLGVLYQGIIDRTAAHPYSRRSQCRITLTISPICREIFHTFRRQILEKIMKRNKYLKKITKFIYAAFAAFVPNPLLLAFVVAAIRASTANAAPGDLFVGDLGSGTIYKSAPDGAQRTFATGLTNPLGLAFDSDKDNRP